MKNRAVEVLQASYNVAVFVFVGLLVVCGVFGILALPVQVAARHVQGPTPTALALLVMVVIGVVALVSGWDAFAYIYGLRRPMIVPGPRGDRWRLVSRVAGSPSEIISTCFISYGSVLYLFVVLYLWLSYSDTASFCKAPLSITDAIYFTLSTAATVGYGDICACSSVARAMVSVQIIVCFVAAVFMFSVAAGLAVRPAIDRERSDRDNVDE